MERSLSLCYGIQELLFHRFLQKQHSGISKYLLHPQKELRKDEYKGKRWTTFEEYGGSFK